MTKIPEGFTPTGCLNLDKALGGGFPDGSVALLYGEAGTGKTCLAIQCAVLCARRGEKAIYVDSAGGFTVERLVQTARDAHSHVKENLVVFTPQSFRAQVLVVEALDRYITERTGIVVVDTVTGFYRLELSSVDETFTLNRQLNRMMAYLRQLAVSQRICVLAISQVHTYISPRMDNRFHEIVPVAQRVLNHWSSVSVKLTSTPSPGLKDWSIEKGVDGVTGVRSLIMVTTDGVFDAPKAKVSARSDRPFLPT